MNTVLAIAFCRALVCIMKTVKIENSGTHLSAPIRRGRAPKARMDEGRLDLPADFLIASDGTVVASKYGVHSYDQWSVDELLGLVASKNT